MQICRCFLSVIPHIRARVRDKSGRGGVIGGHPTLSPRYGGQCLSCPFHCLFHCLCICPFVCLCDLGHCHAQMIILAFLLRLCLIIKRTRCPSHSSPPTIVVNSSHQNVFRDIYNIEKEVQEKKQNTMSIIEG